MLIRRQWTRRELVRDFVRAGMSAAAAAACAGIEIHGQRRIRRGASSTPVIPEDGDFDDLQVADMVPQGYIRINQSGLSHNLTEASGSIGGYRVTGSGEFDINCYVTGYTPNGSPISEHSLSGLTPNMTIASAGSAPLVHEFGPLNENHTIASDDTPVGSHDTARVTAGGLDYKAIDATHGWLATTYGHNYTNDGYPNINFHRINHSTFAVDTYGPMKFGCGSEMARGGILQIPQALADLYFGGRTRGSQGYVKSGIASKPLGANLELWSYPSDPSALTASTSWHDSAIQIPTANSIRHDASNPQSRDVRYTVCGWTGGVHGAYACEDGYYTETSVPTFGGPTPLGRIEDDTMRGSVIVRTQGLSVNKQGWLNMGTLVRKPSVGWSGAGDVNGYPHAWYGDPDVNGGFGNQHCCHGQYDLKWGATGPGNGYRDTNLWIYRVEDIAAAYAGLITPYGATPYLNQIEMRQIGSELAGPTYFDQIIGVQMWFDVRFNNIFIGYMKTDPSNAGYASPMIFVIKVV